MELESPLDTFLPTTLDTQEAEMTKATTKVLRKLDIEEVKEFINKQSPETRVYLGSDSERLRIKGEWYADYMVVIAVHIDGKHGCKVFGEVTRERVFDQKMDRPALRLMAEVHKVSEVFQELRETLYAREALRVDAINEKIDDLIGDMVNAKSKSMIKFLDKQVDMLETEIKENCIYEVHLDINPNKMHGSSCVFDEARGYIQGTCEVTPLLKPQAFAASFAADRGISLLGKETPKTGTDQG